MGGSIIAPMLILGVFVRAVASRVEPPTGLVLRCRNMSNVLEWSYGEHQPGLRFRTDILHYYSRKSDELWVEPPDLRADISFLSDVSDSYLITLTAVIGENESAPSDEIMFSYYPDAPLVTHKCFLDFPPVNVTSKGDDSLLVSFRHPASVYNINSTSRQNSDQKRRRSADYEMDEELPEFAVKITFINETTGDQTFTCVENECEQVIQVDRAQMKHCLEFSGEMMTMKVQGKQYCTLSEARKDFTYIYIIVGSLLFLAMIAFIFSMVYRKKTRASTPFPDSMTIAQRLKQFTSGVVPEQVFVPVVGPASPTPLLSSGEEKDGKDLPPSVSPSTDELRLPIGIREHEDDDVKVDCDEEPGYMKGKTFEDEEPEVPSGYEKRPVLVELAPDEQAQGYRN